MWIIPEVAMFEILTWRQMSTVSCWRVYACVAHHSYITLILKSLTRNEILLWARHFSVFPTAENDMFYFVMLTVQVVDYVTSRDCL